MPEEKQMTPEATVDSKFLSGIFGLTIRQVNKLAADGVIPTLRTKPKNQYLLKEAVMKYIEYRALDREVDEDSLENKKLKADIRIKEARANIAELQEAQVEGKLIDAVHVRDYMARWKASVRGSIMSLPGKLAMEISLEEDPSVCSGMIKRECKQVLEDLSSFDYSEKYFTDLAREKVGLEGEDDEDS